MVNFWSFATQSFTIPVFVPLTGSTSGFCSATEVGIKWEHGQLCLLCSLFVCSCCVIMLCDHVV